MSPVRALFRKYAEFLRSSGGHHSFPYDGFEAEILDLPRSFTSKRGEVLVAVDSSVTDRTSVVAGCIAYRAPPESPDSHCCEFKRLFVHPDFRGQNLGRQLIRAALHHARRAGYQAARLDTDPVTMPAAYRIYLSEGFAEYREAHGAGHPDLVFLQRALM